MERAPRVFLKLVGVRRIRWGAVAAALAAAAALAPTAANASTVAVNADGVVVFDAAPGELNDVSYGGGPGAYTISDSGATLHPGAGCDDGVTPVTCHGSSLLVNLGDGDDEAATQSWGAIGESVRGGDGNDTLTGNVDGGPGNDILVAYGQGTTARGGPGEDTVSDSGIALAIDGGPGNDHLHARFPTTGADGGDGDDVVEGEAGFLRGNAGNDRLVTLTDCDVCHGSTNQQGGDGDDELVGGRAADVLDGGPGADTLRGQGGRDTMLGGDGNDTLEVGGPKWYQGPDLPPDPFSPGSRDAPPPPPIDGGPGNDRIDGGPNPETLHGGDGDDWMSGGDGSDTLDGGPGADTLDGGAGKYDKVDFTGDAQGLTVDLTRPRASGHPGEHDTYLPNVEFFLLSDGADRFAAADAPVTVYGNLGDDKITGSPEVDRLVGDTVQGQFTDRPEGYYGNDVIDGRGGDDEINGDSGNDRLDGGAGNDRIDGGRPVIFHDGGSTRKPNDDTIHGGPGDDDILHGLRVWGGTGNDSIVVASFLGTNLSPLIALGRGGAARCGAGNDHVGGDYYDELALDCELVHEGSRSWGTLRADRRGKATLKARCAWDFAARCRGRVSVVSSSAETVRSVYGGIAIPRAVDAAPASCHRTRAGLVLATGRFRLRAGRVNRMGVKLTRTGRRVVARAGCILGRTRMRFSDPRHHRHEMTRTTALRWRRP